MTIFGFCHCTECPNILARISHQLIIFVILWKRTPYRKQQIFPIVHRFQKRKPHSARGCCKRFNHRLEVFCVFYLYELVICQNHLIVCEILVSGKACLQNILRFLKNIFIKKLFTKINGQASYIHGHIYFYN